TYRLKLGQREYAILDQHLTCRRRMAGNIVVVNADDIIESAKADAAPKRPKVRSGQWIAHAAIAREVREENLSRSAADVRKQSVRQSRIEVPDESQAEPSWQVGCRSKREL